MPQNKSQRIPSYRLHKPSGLATVRLNGKDFYLGKYDSIESKKEYERIIAEWLGNHRTLPIRQHRPDDIGLTVNELFLAYWSHAERYYTKSGIGTSTLASIKASMKHVKDLYGRTAVAEFGPLSLKVIRSAMIRSGLSRRAINKYIDLIKSMFKWGTENELVKADIYHALQAVSGLRKGRSDARETEPIEPVAVQHIAAIKPYVSNQVWAMIQLQLHTGMRPGEVVTLRGCDLNISGKVWEYHPTSHKTEHHGCERAIYIGPKGQQIIEPFLKPDLSAYLFSPVDAEKERRTLLHQNRKIPLSHGNGPGTNCKVSPRWKARDKYDVNSYRKGIARACDKAFPPPEHLRPLILPKGKRETQQAYLARLSDDEKVELKAWQKAHRWHPHQLRHNAATLLRREYGIEAARVVLGHTSAAITEIYAEVDRMKAADIMAKIG